MFKWFLNLFLDNNKSTKNKKRFLDDYEFNEIRKYKEDRINSILDKISKKGISSLSKSDLEQLEKLNKNKNKNV
jgi:hypothetical protein